MIVYDPSGFLGDHHFTVQGQAYSSVEDVYNKPGPRIAILDYLSSIEPDRSMFDLIIWYTLENFYVIKSRVQDPRREVTMTPNSQGSDFCLSNWIHSTADIYKKSYFKPNLNCKYTATVLIGRISDRSSIKRNLNRAWIYYEFLERSWQNTVMATVRDQVSQESLLDQLSCCSTVGISLQKKIDLFGEIAPQHLPDYNKYESADIRQALHSGQKTTDIFDQGNLFDRRNLIPEHFYQNSFCDIVLQDYEQPGSFIDEKISKPLIMGRPFVVITSQHYLKNLRELGFQTFDPVIDESYDSEPDPVKRWTMVADQINKLSKSNFQSVSDHLKKIIKHNRKLACNSEYWSQRLKNWMNQKIQQITHRANVII